MKGRISRGSWIYEHAREFYLHEFLDDSPKDREGVNIGCSVAAFQPGGALVDTIAFWWLPRGSAFHKKSI
jgi:hypothetical protein